MGKLKEVAGAVLDESIPFEVDIINPTLIQRLRKEKKKSFTIRPATLGTMLKISNEVIGIKKFKQEEILDKGFNFALIKDHAERMARIVCFAVQNSKQDPSKNFINFFLENLTSKELYRLVGIILAQIDTVNFLKSIISARGINLLEVNPKTQGSSVAPGTQSEAL